MIMNISVCMATYNGEQYIKEQLDSVLSQLSENDEVIISDDSSTDKTIGIIESYNDNRIKIYENQGFKSPIYNFENAIKMAEGDIIVLADQDDVWLENKILITREHFKDHYSTELLVLDGRLVDKNLNTLEDSIFKRLNSKKGLFKNIIKNSYLGCNMAFTSDMKEFILPFPKKISMHDVWIGLVFELYGNIHFIEKVTLLHRRHNQTSTKAKYSLIQKISWRLFNIVSLIHLLIRKLLDEKL
tara:strand:+ start:5256 stop:5984 length:729 start_codon:yes stop_codon:yes gene_type:complete